MRTLSLWVIGITTALIILCGCHKTSTTPEPAPIVLGSVEVWMNRGVVSGTWPDTISATGVVTVLDESQTYMSGAEVQLATVFPFGQITFTDSIRQNVTDDSGHVRFVYSCQIPEMQSEFYNPWNAVTAQVGSKSAHWLLWFDPIRLPEDVARVNSWVTPDTIHLRAQSPDSLHVFCEILDFPHSNPVSGAVCPFQTEDGRIMAMRATDTTGITTLMWRPPNIVGRHYCIVGGGDYTDTLWATVLP